MLAISRRLAKGRSPGFIYGGPAQSAGCQEHVWKKEILARSGCSFTGICINGAVDN